MRSSRRGVPPEIPHPFNSLIKIVQNNQDFTQPRKIVAECDLEPGLLIFEENAHFYAAFHPVDSNLIEYLPTWIQHELHKFGNLSCQHADHQKHVCDVNECNFCKDCNIHPHLEDTLFNDWALTIKILMEYKVAEMENKSSIFHSFDFWIYPGILMLNSYDQIIMRKVAKILQIDIQLVRKIHSIVLLNAKTIHCPIMNHLKLCCCLFLHSSFFNHRCQKNNADVVLDAGYYMNKPISNEHEDESFILPSIRIYSNRKIKKGEEITINYFEQYSTLPSYLRVLSSYFECTCPDDCISTTRLPKELENWEIMICRWLGIYHDPSRYLFASQFHQDPQEFVDIWNSPKEREIWFTKTMSPLMIPCMLSIVLKHLIIDSPFDKHPLSFIDCSFAPSDITEMCFRIEKHYGFPKCITDRFTKFRPLSSSSSTKKPSKSLDMEMFVTSVKKFLNIHLNHNHHQGLLVEKYLIAHAISSLADVTKIRFTEINQVDYQSKQTLLFSWTVFASGVIPHWRINAYGFAMYFNNIRQEFIKLMVDVIAKIEKASADSFHRPIKKGTKNQKLLRNK